jgi:hypothetical protein
MLNKFIQLKEYEICRANKWNFNQGTGYEIVASILHMSQLQNVSSRKPGCQKIVMDEVTKMAQRLIFGKEAAVSTYR